MDSKPVSSMLQAMLGDFSKVMDANFPDLSWMVHKGTLLSLCRDSGMLPWDDDVDVYIALANKESQRAWWADSFPALASAMRSRGWRIDQEYKCLASIRPREGIRRKDNVPKWRDFVAEARRRKPASDRSEAFALAGQLRANGEKVHTGSCRLDIHVHRPINGTFPMTANLRSKRVAVARMLPTQKRQWYDLMIPVPRSPHAVLETLYGPMWKKQRALNSGVPVPKCVPRRAPPPAKRLRFK